MTLDEAIAHARAKASPTDCGGEHAQLARWLAELRWRRESEWSGTGSLDQPMILCAPDNSCEGCESKLVCPWVQR